MIMAVRTRIFIRLLFLSFVGFAFYYAHIYLGLFDNVLVFKPLAILFCLLALPLPILVVNNKNIFPELAPSGRTVLTLASFLLLVHHFLLTFIFVLFMNGEKMI